MSDNVSIIAISLISVITIAVLLVWRVTTRKQNIESVMNSIMEPYVKDEVKQIIIPDGIGGLLEIEHLILLEQGLFLIESYPMAGNLYGADTIDQWTQIIDGRSYKFANPLRRLRTSRQAIKSLAPNIPVFCRVIFNADSFFPKGKPAEVSVLESLAEDMMVLNNEKMIPEQTQQAWDRILRVARKNGQAVYREGGFDG